MPSAFLTWIRGCFDAPVRRPMRSLAFLRIAVGLILLFHPLHAFLHPEDRAALAQSLSSHGLPFSLGLTWAVLLLQTAASLALLGNRLVGAACAAQILMLGVGIAFVHAPYWYVVGGAAVEGHRGMEYNLLLITFLAGLILGQREAGKGLALIRVSAAAILLTHPLHGFWDWRNLGGFGHFLDRFAFGHGLALVYLMLGTQTACSLALLARRFVVPACLGHLFILATGIALVHWPDWFVVGPGADGMEYSVLYLACFIAVLMAHWPRPVEAPELEDGAFAG